MRTTAKLDQIIRDWTADLDVMPATREDYNRKIRLWFRYLSAVGVEPREPSHKHIVQYKQHLTAQGHTQTGVASYIAVVRLFYKYCEAQKLYSNIGEGIKSSYRKSDFSKQALTKSEAQRLITSIDTSKIIGKRDKLMISIMLTNGLRCCEVERIDIGDFDKYRGRSVIHIQRKGKSGKRDMVAVPPMIDELFEEYISCRDFQMSDPLFLNHSSKQVARLSRISISLIVKERLRAIGIDRRDITAHSLRHTCGSLLIESGVDVETIKDILGHSSTATTRIYIEMAQRQKLLEDTPTKIIADIIQKHPKKLKK